MQRLEAVMTEQLGGDFGVRAARVVAELVDGLGLLERVAGDQVLELMVVGTVAAGVLEAERESRREPRTEVGVRALVRMVSS